MADDTDAGQGDPDDDLVYPTPEGIHAIHDAIVARWDNTPGGTYHEGAIDHAVWAARRAEGDLHHRAATMLETLAVGHGFVDGNKRSATATAMVFYALNGHRFQPDDDYRAVVKAVAGDVDAEPPVPLEEYLREHTARSGEPVEAADVAAQRRLAERAIDADEELFDKLSRE